MSRYEVVSSAGEIMRLGIRDTETDRYLLMYSGDGEPRAAFDGLAVELELMTATLNAEAAYVRRFRGRWRKQLGSLT